MVNELTQLKLRVAELEANLASANRALEEANQEISQQQQEMESLRQFDLEMTRSEDADFVLNLVLLWAKERTHADYGLIARWDEAHEVFVVMKASGFPLEIDYQAGDLMELPAALRPKPQTDKLHAESIIDSRGTRLVAELRHASGRLMGVLDLRRHSSFQFSDTEQKFVRGIADRLAISMHTTMLLSKVEELHHHRRQLFRMLSHDLRQPLTVLMGYLQLAEYALTKDDMDMVRSYIGNISTGAKDLNDLLEEVLLMEQLTETSRESWKTLSLRRLIDKAIEKHSPAASLKSHKLIVLMPDAEANVRGQPLELQEAAANIISNAVKYTPENGRIYIRLMQSEDQWRFEVEDNGFGIAPERQSRIFESFYRAQQPGTETIKGTGLGLSLVKTIIQKHNGDVFFTSEPNHGSTFGFWLPAEDKHE